ncbi:gluconokinase [Microbacterium sp. H1-D42]|uniref:gluconokinase n=1 Tax=Microbacterium sp. H1-D42 TaxID=2925844 RepID=UPI001F53636E|nr:gluconokinase [Microbacterium sp. H1-D42]UNK70721.1 gluconokinase [Microbacterium sp. H1-D42]
MTDIDAGDAPSHDPLVVMGVSGVGKTTIAMLVSERLGMPFIDADDLHGAANVAKMSAGIPLTDEDRMPWLQRVGEALDQHPTPVVACSALKRSYRDALRAHAPRVRFVMLAADLERLSDQVSHREDHFMPPALLQSQLNTLEPLESDEPGVVIRVDAGPEVLADRVIAQLG